MLETMLISTGAVVLAEMGDKTQLLALLLAARFHKNTPIVLGILAATLINHGLAGAFGGWLTTQFSPQTIKWILAGSFIAMGLWMLIPDKEDGASLESEWLKRAGVFTATFVTFFLAEMGDKTQIATIALAVKYPALWVVAGTTLGMLIADVPAVYLGDKLSAKLPMKWIHAACAALFIGLGLATLLF
jgi:putative Ca2+/H+ antiporter (TMEM165/GDT1 family)